MKQGGLYIAIATVMFSTFEVAMKYIAGQIHPIQLTFCRFAVGFLFLLPLALWTLRRRGERLDASAWKSFALLGLLGVALCMPILQLAIHSAGSGVVAVLFSCNPVFVTFLAYFLLQEPILPRHIAALILEILGTVVIISPWNAQLPLRGVVLALLSTALFSVYGVLGKPNCARYGASVVSCFSFLFGSAMLLLLILLTRIPTLASALTVAGLEQYANIPLLRGYTLQNLPVVLYVSAGVAGIGFLTYFLAMEQLPASVVSLIYFFKPAVSPVLAWLLHGEEISGSMLLGICLIVAGSLSAILPGLWEARRSALGEKSSHS